MVPQAGAYVGYKSESNSKRIVQATLRVGGVIRDLDRFLGMCKTLVVYMYSTLPPSGLLLSPGACMGRICIYLPQRPCQDCICIVDHSQPLDAVSQTTGMLFYRSLQIAVALALRRYSILSASPIQLYPGNPGRLRATVHGTVVVPTVVKPGKSGSRPA